MERDEVILTIEWRKSDILEAIQEKGILATQELFEQLISQRNIRMLEEYSIATGWDIIYSVLAKEI